MVKQLSWKELQEIKRKDQEEVLEAWKKGELSDGSEYSDEEKQSMIDNSHVKIELLHVSHYEYDPYGNAVVIDGALGIENLYRFSTKYFDDEVGLYYYGYR